MTSNELSRQKLFYACCAYLASFLSTQLKKKSTSYEVLFFLERCVPQAERDAHFVRDVCFASDVRFAREDAEHITSLCDEGAKHHCAIALHHFGEADASLFTNTPKYAIIKSERRCYYEKQSDFNFY